MSEFSAKKLVWKSSEQAVGYEGTRVFQVLHNPNIPQGKVLKKAQLLQFEHEHDPLYTESCSMLMLNL